jgi:hypothetical protein
LPTALSCTTQQFTEPTAEGSTYRVLSLPSGIPTPAHARGRLGEPTGSGNPVLSDKIMTQYVTIQFLLLSKHITNTIYLTVFMVRIIGGTMWILQMLKCVVGAVTIVLSIGSTFQNFALYCAVFTKYTDSYLHMHVGLCAVNFNNIIIYMYTYASQVAAVYHVQITVRGLTTPAAVDMAY